MKSEKPPGAGGAVKLNEAFQYVDDFFLDLVEQEKVFGRKTAVPGSTKPARMFLTGAAACLCLLLVLPVAAMAHNWFGLKDLLLPETPGPAFAGPGKGFDLPEFDIISLSGYHTSPEAQALAEWEKFLAGYDPDGKIAAEIGNDLFAAPNREDWLLYNVYSYEMGEKLDEIAGKYGLKLHQKINDVSPQELEYQTGGTFIKNSTNYWGYIYEDGTFQFDGDVEIEGFGTASFQFRRAVKGSFQDVALNIGDAENYTEWQYLTACGEPVLLALGDSKALLFADFDDCFIAVNVLDGSRSGMTREDLQRLADLIDFQILKEVQIPDMRGDS
ncbi:MAG: hypothetical protein HFG25_00315 [Lachnospiraceae bacterium]|jgi:hypothetical protein|nr:hypothetical protein [Lachnospiraceae bacterium]